MVLCQWIKDARHQINKAKENKADPSVPSLLVSEYYCKWMLTCNKYQWVFASRNLQKKCTLNPRKLDSMIVELKYLYNIGKGIPALAKDFSLLSKPDREALYDGYIDVIVRRFNEMRDINRQNLMYIWDENPCPARGDDYPTGVHDKYWADW